MRERRARPGRSDDGGVPADVDGAGPAVPGASAPDPDDAEGMGRRQIRGSAVLLLGRMLSVLLTTAVQVLIVRILTKEDYGAFAYALALAAAARLLLSLGQGRLLSRFVSTYEEQRDYGRMFGSMLLAAGTIVATGTVSIAALFLFRGVLIGSAVDDPVGIQVVLILAFLAPLEAFDQVFVSLFAVFSRARAIFFRKYLFIPGLRLLVVLALAIGHAGIVFLAVGYLASQAVGMVVYVLMLRRMLRERGLLQHLRWRAVTMPVRSVFAFSVPLITNELLVLSMNAGGVLLLAHFQTLAEVANYRAVQPAAKLNQVILSVFVTLYLPMAARLFARGDIAGLRRGYWRTAVVVAVFSFPIFAVTGPLAPGLTVFLFGERYAGSAVVLALLSTGYFFNVMLGFNTYTVQVCGRLRFLVLVNVLAGLLNLGLNLLLVPRWGALGVAVANCATFVVMNLCNQWALRRSIGTAFIPREYLRCYAVIVGAAVGLWVFQILVDPHLLLALPVAAAVSVGVLLVNRRALELRETVPEIARIPVLRMLVR